MEYMIDNHIKANNKINNQNEVKNLDTVYTYNINYFQNNTSNMLKFFENLPKSYNKSRVFYIKMKAKNTKNIKNDINFQ